MSEVNDPNGLVHVSGMYEEYFLDYASYVILERAVPALFDGLKPVQRRILFSMKTMDDGRYHKVANIIGQTMQYHPHGDAAIGEALVKIGQKDLMVDTQGNWGDYRTGDSAAAPRYIEARLTKFALHIAFNADTTEWQLAYDGRKKEPFHLPVKFPLLLSQGAEGIAVGLSTKILPHNFNELIKACIAHLKGKPFQLYPDFPTGGAIDVADYQKGHRGGKVKVRATIEIVDNKALKITQIPYGVTTGVLIDSILKANEKGKIKIKQVIDNTAEKVEISILLPSGTSPQLTLDALYAFTKCEISIHPNACVIVDNKPIFTNVSELLRLSVDHTKALLKWELEIALADLQNKWFFANLVKIFIEKRIYRDIEECETWEEVLEAIRKGLSLYVSTPSDRKENDDRLHLNRDITEDDIVKLTEIKIKRISKYNSFKADEQIKQLEKDLEQVQHHLNHLTEYTIDYFTDLASKFGAGHDRKTKIMEFDQIDATEVVANNAKLYINRKEGFIGTGIKKEEFIKDCSDIDDIIIFLKSGEYKVVRVGEKVFVGKDILHADIWKKGDERTTYNAIYLDGKSRTCYVKRFHVKAITRDKPYHITTETPNSKLLYFSANPNGEAEIVKVVLSQASRARKKVFEYDFSALDIKGRGSKGNQLTKYPVRKIELLEQGVSTLEAIDIWVDEVSGRLNTDERGKHIGAFNSDDLILVVYKNGHYELIEFDLLKKVEVQSALIIEKFDAKKPLSVVYFEGEKQWTMVKRFLIETSTSDQKFLFLTDHSKTKLLYCSTDSDIELSYNDSGNAKQISLDTFIDLKGWKALGNKLSDHKITKIQLVKKEQFKPGDTLEFD